MPTFLLIPVIYLAFVSLGLPDSIFGVAWPIIRAEMGAPLEAAGLVALVLTSGAVISSVASGFVAKRLSTGPVVLISSILTALGLLGYSLAPSYAWVLVSALPLGIGSGGVDSNLNGYVAAHYSSRHMNWLHASWGIGAMIGPLVMTAVMTGQGNWRGGFRVISSLQGLLALVFVLSLGLWAKVAVQRQEASKDSPSEGAHVAGGKEKVHGLKRPEPWIQMAMFALYCACEYSIVLWTVSMLVESRGMEASVAGKYISLYYGGIMGGRILTGLVADRWGNRFMVRIGLALALVGILLFSLSSVPWLVLPGLLLVGLGYSPVYPCLMHETPARFDESTYQKVIGFSMGAAAIGSSAIPGVVGLIASALGLEAVGPCVAFLIVLLFSLSELLNRRT